jgi:hypothetical protein
MPRTSDRQRAAVSPFVPGTRPPAPPDLSEREAALWDEIIASVPQNWIPQEAFALLVNLTRHITFADDLAAEISALRAEQAAAEAQPPPESSKVERERGKAAAARRRLWLRLLRDHGFQTARIASLETKLRLPPSSRSSGDRALGERKRASSDAVKPWNDWPGAQQ